MWGSLGRCNVVYQLKSNPGSGVFGWAGGGRGIFFSDPGEQRITNVLPTSEEDVNNSFHILVERNYPTLVFFFMERRKQDWTTESMHLSRLRFRSKATPRFWQRWLTERDGEPGLFRYFYFPDLWSLSLSLPTGNDTRFICIMADGIKWSVSIQENKNSLKEPLSTLKTKFRKGTWW